MGNCCRSSQVTEGTQTGLSIHDLDEQLQTEILRLRHTVNELKQQTVVEDESIDKKVYAQTANGRRVYVIRREDILNQENELNKSDEGVPRESAIDLGVPLDPEEFRKNQKRNFEVWYQNVVDSAKRRGSRSSLREFLKRVMPLVSDGALIESQGGMDQLEADSDTRLRLDTGVDSTRTLENDAMSDDSAIKVNNSSELSDETSSSVTLATISRLDLSSSSWNMLEQCKFRKPGHRFNMRSSFRAEMAFKPATLNPLQLEQCQSATSMSGSRPKSRAASETGYPSSRSGGFINRGFASDEDEGHSCSSAEQSWPTPHKGILKHGDSAIVLDNSRARTASDSSSMSSTEFDDMFQPNLIETKFAKTVEYGFRSKRKNKSRKRRTAAAAAAAAASVRKANSQIDDKSLHNRANNSRTSFLMYI